MLSRSAVARQTARSVGQFSNRRAASQYQTSESNGIKVAARDFNGPVSSVSLVSKAGTRFQPLPGLAEGLQRYAFGTTQRRTKLRIQRESELLGSELFSHHSRENVVVGAKFLRDDLPYFLELLAEVATQTKYQEHVFHEEIYPLLQLAEKKILKDTKLIAVDSAHSVAFHRGLGDHVHPFATSNITKYLDAETLSEFAAAAYSKPNFAVVANGAAPEEVSKWVQQFFTDVPSQPAFEIKAEQAKYYGGEERIPNGSATSSLVLGFSGSSAPTGPFFKPEVSVLAALLGGQSTIKWSPGFSLLSQATQGFTGLHVETKSHIYSDAGLLTIALSGSGKDISAVAPKVVETLKSIAQGVSKENFAKAKALAKFKELEFGQGTQAATELTGAGLIHQGKPYQFDEVANALDSVTAEKVAQVAKEALETKASVSAVGDLHKLPYAGDLGLKV